MADSHAQLLLRKQLKGGCGGSSMSVHCYQVLQGQLLDSCRPEGVLLIYAELTKHPVEGFSAGLVDDSNIFEWQVTIIGPPDTY